MLLRRQCSLSSSAIIIISNPSSSLSSFITSSSSSILLQPTTTCVVRICSSSSSSSPSSAVFIKKSSKRPLSSISKEALLQRSTEKTEQADDNVAAVHRQSEETPTYRQEIQETNQQGDNISTRENTDDSEPSSSLAVEISPEDQAKLFGDNMMMNNGTNNTSNNSSKQHHVVFTNDNSASPVSASSSIPLAERVSQTAHSWMTEERKATGSQNSSRFSPHHLSDGRLLYYCGFSTADAHLEAGQVAVTIPFSIPKKDFVSRLPLLCRAVSRLHGASFRNDARCKPIKTQQTILPLFHQMSESLIDLEMMAKDNADDVDSLLIKKKEAEIDGELESSDDTNSEDNFEAEAEKIDIRIKSIADSVTDKYLVVTVQAMIDQSDLAKVCQDFSKSNNSRTMMSSDDEQQQQDAHKSAFSKIQQPEGSKVEEHATYILNNKNSTRKHQLNQQQSHVLIHTSAMKRLFRKPVSAIHVVPETSDD